MNILTRHIPPLAAGDNLTREEFLRIWEAHPEIKNAELIGGIVYMPSPVSFEHGEIDSTLGYWLRHYVLHTPGTKTGHNATTLMNEDAPQPDLYVRILPEYGGQASIEGNLLQGAPELIVEICLSSAVYDLHQKYTLYEPAGVQEYVALLLHEQEIRWHVLGSDGFERLAAEAGVWRSRVFPGLWLHGEALLKDDLARVLETLQQGLNAPEHAEFVQRLAARQRETASDQ